MRATNILSATEIGEIFLPSGRLLKTGRHFFLGGAAALAVLGALPAFAQETSDEEIVITGTRVANRSRLDSVAPVDVVSSSTLQNSGTTELSQALSVTLPSLDFPRPSITDGTDSVRPATLRGLAPDQTLVLINSKRAHASALVNINNSIGRGSAAVDLNTVPSVTLNNVEVLRDGASAQYGSDAIAGVINLRLREAREGGGASVVIGQYAGTLETAHNKRDISDGRTYTVSGWQGVPLGAEGFLTLSGEYLDRSPTSRGDIDLRLNGNAALSPTGSLVSTRAGDPQIEQYSVWANAGLPLSADWSLYGWVGYQNRDSNSAANPRLTFTTTGNAVTGFTNSGLNTAQTVASVVPAGFLPSISPIITDLNSTGGIKGSAGGWDIDFSAGYGRNEIQYSTVNSLNASIARAQTTPGIANNPYFGQTPQRNFKSGSLTYQQTTANVDVTRQLDFVSLDTTLAAGIEYRNEKFAEGAGELASYDIARTNTGAAIIFAGVPTQPQGGSQGFPGLQAADAQSGSRHSWSTYAELDSALTDKLQASIAGRYENYSDFGDTVTGKVSARYDFTDSLALRAAVSSGFRAPALQQTSFTATSTNFISGVATDILTTRASSPLAAALGGKPLKAEEATNYAAGAVVRLGALTATIDAYYIEIDDRIVLSDNITGSATGTATQQAIYALVSPFSPTATGARFFINGVDTVTRGLDAVIAYRANLASAGTLNLTATGNLNSTDVTKVPTTAQLSALPVPPLLFPDNQVLAFERGTPNYKIGLSADWELGWFGATVRGTQYGGVLIPQPSVNGTWRQDASFVMDAEARAKWNKATFSLGANNVLDEYPTKAPDAFNGVNIYVNGAAAFSNYSPYGFGGRYIYGKVAYGW